jgi:hypothetical protein
MRRLIGDEHLDLGCKLRLTLRTASATLVGPLRYRLRDEMERAIPGACAIRLQSIVPYGPREPQLSIFWPRQMQRVAQNPVSLSSSCRAAIAVLVIGCKGRYPEAGTTSPALNYGPPPSDQLVRRYPVLPRH